MNEARQKAVDEACRLAVDALYSEKGHFAAAARWRLVQLWLGLPATLIAAAAGATFFEGTLGAWVPGFLAFAASALTAIITFLNPSDWATRHQVAGVQYGQLRRQIRQLAQIVAKLSDTDDQGFYNRLEELTAQVGKLQIDSPHIPKYAARNAFKEIKRGSADYTFSEISAAIGNLSAQVPESLSP